MLIVLCIMGLVCMSQNTIAQNNQPKPIDKNPNELIKTAKSGRKFVENKGQWDANVLGMTQSDGMDIWVTKEGLVYDVFKYSQIDSSKSNNPNLADDLKSANPMENMKREGHVFKMEFLNNKAIKAHGVGKQKSYYNYFVGDKSKWASQVGHYDEMLMDESFEGVDTRLHFDNGNFRYDFIVKENADPRKIAFRINGDEGSKINSKGEIDINTSLGKISHKKLFAYQENGTSKKQVECSFVKGDDGNYHFEVGEYDRSKKLIIDPSVVFAFPMNEIDTEEWLYGMDNDDDGNIYFTGTTGSIIYPTTLGAYQTSTSNSNFNSYFTKIDKKGEFIIYSTFFGPNNLRALTLKIHKTQSLKNLVYIAGVTGNINASSFWTNQIRPSNPFFGGDVFLAVFSADANNTNDLIYSTYWGHTASSPNQNWSGKIVITDMDVTSEGRALVCGYIRSALNDYFETTANALYPNLNSPSPLIFDGIVAVINPQNLGIADLFYSSYIHGTQNSQNEGNEFIWGIRNFKNTSLNKNQMYIVGETTSINYFCTPNSITDNKTASDVDGFLTIINYEDNPQNRYDQIAYSTLLRSDGGDAILALDLNDQGHAYITGIMGQSNNDDAKTWPNQTTPTINRAFSNQRNIADGYFNNFAFFSIIDVTQSNQLGIKYFSKICRTISTDYSKGLDIKVDNCGRANILGQIGWTTYSYQDEFIFKPLKPVNPISILFNNRSDAIQWFYVSIQPDGNDQNDLIFASIIETRNSLSPFNIYKSSRISVFNDHINIGSNTNSPFSWYRTPNSILTNIGSEGDISAVLTSIKVECQNNYTECCDAILNPAIVATTNQNGECCYEISMFIPYGTCVSSISLDEYDDFKYQGVFAESIVVPEGGLMWTHTICNNNRKFEGRIRLHDINFNLICDKDIELASCESCCARIKSLEIVKDKFNSQTNPPQCCFRIQGLVDTKTYTRRIKDINGHDIEVIINPNCITSVEITDLATNAIINSGYNYTNQSQTQVYSDLICINGVVSKHYKIQFKNDAGVAVCTKFLDYQCESDCCNLIKSNLNVTFEQVGGPSCYNVVINLPNEIDCDISELKVERDLGGGSWSLLEPVTQNVIFPHQVAYTICCMLSVGSNPDIDLKITLYDNNGLPCVVTAHKTCPGGITAPKVGTNEQEKGDANNNHSQILDYNIQPNPTNDKTTINFTLTEKANVKLELFNSLGNSVSVIKEQMFNPGGNLVEFDASQLSQGAYFVKVSIDATNSITIPLSVVK